MHFHLRGADLHLLKLRRHERGGKRPSGGTIPFSHPEQENVSHTENALRGSWPFV